MPFLGVVERVLVGGTGHTDRLGADGGAGGLERLHGGLGVAVLALTDPGQTLIELLLAAEQAAAGNPDVVEHHLGGVAGPDAVLLVLLAHAEARACPGGTMKLA